MIVKWCFCSCSGASGKSVKIESTESCFMEHEVEKILTTQVQRCYLSNIHRLRAKKGGLTTSVNIVSGTSTSIHLEAAVAGLGYAILSECHTLYESEIHIL